MFARARIFGAAGLVFALSAACVFGRGTGGTRTDPKFGENMNSESRREGDSLVVGYIDMSEARHPLNFAQLVQIHPPSERPYWSFRVFDGLFYAEYIPMGAYVFASFGDYGRTINNISRQNSPFELEVDRPNGIHFVGSYKYVRTRRRSYDLIPVAEPSEREVLTRLLPNAEGSPWQARIEAHLARLQ